MGTTLPLTIQCVANYNYGLGFGYFNVEFEVTYTIPNGCIAQIDPSASYIERQIVVWGEEYIVPSFTPYTYTSDSCPGFPITYEAQQRTASGALIPLPSELQFYPQDRMFVAKKCVSGDPDSQMDYECTDDSIMPYTKKYRIVVIATLTTDIQTFVNFDNEFDFVITPDCRDDTLSLMSDWTV